MRDRRLTEVARKGGAAALSLALLTSGCPAVAWAQGEGGSGESGQCDAGNGWVLSYTAAQGEACITGVATVGSGALSIPSTAGACAVTSIGRDAFAGQQALAGVTIPDSVTTIGTSAFRSSGVTQVSLPVALEKVPVRCFSGCERLADVEFRSSTLGSVGLQAFYECSALTVIDLPQLTSYLAADADDPNADPAKRIGRKAFAGCSSLETLILRNDLSTTSRNYFSYSDCFIDCPKLANIVFYGKRSYTPSGGQTTTSSNYGEMKVYQTLHFYASEEDAEAYRDETAVAVYLNTTPIRDIVTGTASEENRYYQSGAIPALPEGKVWGVSDGGLKEDTTRLTDSYQVYPVDADDLRFAYVSSPKIKATHESASATSSSTPTFYIGADGVIPELANLVVYAADGTVIDPAAYELKFERSPSSGVWEGVAQVTRTGTFRVSAVKKGGAHAGTATPTVEFSVATFSPTLSAYVGSDEARSLGRASAAAAGYVSGGDPKFAVVVSAGNWRHMLIASALAGLGKGVVLFDEGKSVSGEAVRAFVQSGVDSVQVVGSTAAVGQSADPTAETYLMDLLRSRDLLYQSRYADDATVQSLSEQVYTTLRDLHAGKDTWGAGWGDTALIVSPEAGASMAPVAQLAYQLAAPVFFTEADGTLPATVLAHLRQDGFKHVLIAGDASAVPAACASAVEQACGFAPSRVLDVGATSGERCANFTEALTGEGAAGISTLVVASTSSPANVVAAAQLAATGKGMLLTCASTLDGKAIQRTLQALLARNGLSSIERVYYVGDFATTDPLIQERVGRVWTAPLGTGFEVGDTVEAGDFVFRLNAQGTAVLCGLHNREAVDAVVPPEVSYDGKTYAVTALAGGAFSGCTTLKTVSLPAAVTALPASAFAGCTALARVALAAPVTSVGASAFEGCASLSSLSLGSKVASIGARAFSGCTRLASLALPATLTAVGASAFAGCTALAKVTLPAKLTTLGAGAFAGCTRLASVSGGAALKAVPASAFEGCTALGSVALGSKVTSIGARAFFGCKKLKAASVPSAVKSIGASAFAGCTALATVTGGAKLKTVGGAAFQGCAKLKSVTLSSKVLASIGAKAFYGCKRLKAVTLKSTKLKAAKVGKQAFKGLPAKAAFKVPAKKRAAYKKAFVKAGLSKKATFKKA